MDILLIGRIAEDGVLELISAHKEEILERYPHRYVSEGIAGLSADFVDDTLRGILKNLEADFYTIGRQGLFQALYRLGESKDCGLKVWIEKIPIKQFCIEVSDLCDTDPYRISSLGCVLVCCAEGNRLARELTMAGYEAAVIGCSTGDRARCVVTEAGLRYLTPEP